ncbi:MAG: metallophosphoesterase, partial [Clostridia bacterium]
YLREIERLRLSLNAMQKERKDTDTVIGMTHFPPFNAFYDESELINLFVKYDVPTVVYGHLHGKDCRADLNFHKFGINFYLTSCDLVDLKLTKIL